MKKSNKKNTTKYVLIFNLATDPHQSARILFASAWGPHKVAGVDV